MYSKMDYDYYKCCSLQTKEREGPCQGLTGRTSAISIFSWTWNTTHTSRPSSSSAYPKSRCASTRVGINIHSRREHRIRTGSASEPYLDVYVIDSLYFDSISISSPILVRYWIEDTFLFLELGWDGILTWWLSGLSNVDLSVKKDVIMVRYLVHLVKFSGDYREFLNWEKGKQETV